MQVSERLASTGSSSQSSGFEGFCKKSAGNDDVNIATTYFLSFNLSLEPVYNQWSNPVVGVCLARIGVGGGAIYSRIPAFQTIIAVN